MSVMSVCGMVLLALVSSAVIKNIRPEYSVFLSLSVGTVISTITFAGLVPVFEYINLLAVKSAFSKYTLILLKVIIIGFLTEITAGMCVDAGESSLAEHVGFFGRGEILLLTLPLLRDTVEIAGKIMGQ